MGDKVDKVSENEEIMLGFLGIGIVIGLAVFLFTRKPVEYREIEIKEEKKTIN